MPDTWKIADRVKIAIPDRKRDQWARGAADALNGLRGSVASKSPTGARVLVSFDPGAQGPTWWPQQTPPTAWWFDSDEIQPEGANA